MQIDALPRNEDFYEDDWRQVFPNTGEGWGTAYSGTFPAGRLAPSRIADVTADRIESVLYFHAYSPEGYGSVDMFAIARLTDGTYAAVEAWADTTGWGCQDDAEWKVADTLEGALGELSAVYRRDIEKHRI